jgi:hypothetical protein
LSAVLNRRETFSLAGMKEHILRVFENSVEENIWIEELSNCSLYGKTQFHGASLVSIIINLSRAPEAVWK